MSPIKLSDISLSKLRGYRDFLFQPEISNPTHRLFFSLDNYETWATYSGYELYETWLKNAKDLTLEADHAQPLVDGATVSDIKQFRDIVTTPKYAQDDYFSTHNFYNWIRPVAFEAWVLWFKQAVRVSAESHQEGESLSFSRPSSRMSETASFFSDNDSQIAPYPPLSDASASDCSSTGILVINDNNESDSDDEIEQIPAENSEVLIRGPIKLTAKLVVDTLSVVTSLPSTWGVPRNNSATLVDLSAFNGLPLKSNGDEYSIDAFIRAEDQDSWGGSAGHLAGEVMVFGFNQDDLTESILCRRASLTCNGVNTCKHFDEDILVGCERYEPDPEKMRELWSLELDANEKEAQEEANIILRFYNEMCKVECKIQCSGTAYMRKLNLGRSKFGKEYFIGCSAWKSTERNEHRYMTIPSNVDENLLSKVIESGGILPSNMNSNANCVLVVHRRSAIKKCPYSHVVNGRISKGQMVNRACPTRMVIFIPIDSSVRKAIVFLRNPHNHPMFPKTKPTIEDKKKLKSAINAAGIRGLTVRKLINAPSTTAIYNGLALQIASPAFMDSRKVRDAIHKEKKKDHPMGMGWEGLLHEHMQHESKLPITERYIQSVTVTPEAKWVITMHPRLAKYFHSVLYICIDYTFKRVNGNIDEWEVVGFLERFKRRVTLARFYCDRNTRNAFSRLFSELFRVIHELTGSVLKFHAFFPGDKQAQLRAIILDAEAAQAQGLADELLVYVGKYVPETITTVPRNSLELLMMVLKTCSVHFERNIDKLSKTLPQDTINRLKGFMGLQTHNEVQEWHEFCQNSSEKSVRDWYQQKINNPWFLPSVNKFLSKMDETSWNLTPNHSNLVESSHSGTNKVTSIGMEIGEAVMSARDLDNSVADRLDSMEHNAVLPNHWNGPSEREHLSRQRRDWSYAKKMDRDKLLSQNDDFTSELLNLSTQVADSLSLEKSLQTHIKELRDSQGTDHKGSIKELKQQVEDEKEKRRQYKTRRQEINKLIQELKDAGLTGSRVNGRRPLTSENTPSEITQDEDDATVLLNASVTDVQSALGSIDSDELEGCKNINNIHEVATLSAVEFLERSEPVGLDGVESQNINVEKSSLPLVESFTEMLANSNIGEYNNHRNGDEFPSLQVETDFDVINSGFNFNVEDWDFDNLDFNSTLPTGNPPVTLLPLYTPPRQTNLEIASLKDIEESTASETSGPANMFSQTESKPAYHSRASKRKQVEIDEADILPEGSRRIRTKSAKALALEKL